MDFVTIKIEGLKEAEAAMKLLPERLAKRAGAEAVRAGAAVFRKSILAKVPVKTGKLKRSIQIKMLTKGRDPLKIQALVGPTQGRKAKSDGWYGRLVEFGTVHAQAHPFIRPAFDESQHAATQAMIDKLGPAIEKQANIFAYGKKK